MKIKQPEELSQEGVEIPLIVKKSGVPFMTKLKLQNEKITVDVPINNLNKEALERAFFIANIKSYTIGYGFITVNACSEQDLDRCFKIISANVPTTRFFYRKDRVEAYFNEFKKI